MDGPLEDAVGALVEEAVREGGHTPLAGRKGATFRTAFEGLLDELVSGLFAQARARLRCCEVGGRVGAGGGGAAGVASHDKRLQSPFYGHSQYVDIYLSYLCYAFHPLSQGSLLDDVMVPKVVATLGVLSKASITQVRHNRLRSLPLFHDNTFHACFAHDFSTSHHTLRSSACARRWRHARSCAACAW